MTLALFDFDGTLTHGDTMFAFVRFARGRSRFVFGMLALLPMLVLYSLKLISTEKAKQRLLRHFFGGWTKAELEAAGEKFAVEMIPGMLREKEWKALEQLKNDGALCCIVSASCDAWLIPFCKKHDLRVVCTLLAYDAQDRFAGNFNGANCNRDEKVRRIRETFNLAHYERIVAYGNPGPDDAMLALAHEKHLVR